MRWTLHWLMESRGAWCEFVKVEGLPWGFGRPRSGSEETTGLDRRDQEELSIHVEPRVHYPSGHRKAREESDSEDGDVEDGSLCGLQGPFTSSPQYLSARMTNHL